VSVKQNGFALRAGDCFARRVFALSSKRALAASLVFAVFLWGGNNVGVKVLVASWPPIWVGATRFLCAGLLLLAILHGTDWLGVAVRPPADLKRRLWWRGGLSLAVYIVVFNWAVRCTAVSHVALYLGASPVWALLWEKAGGGKGRNLLQSYGAAALALLGVLVLFWPALESSSASAPGELLGLLASVLWTNFGRQCRALGADLSGAEVTAHTMWRAGLLLMPLGLVEIATAGLVWHPDLVLVQGYCVVAGGVVAFAFWNNALRHWNTSQVYLFNNLIPLSTMLWARALLKEPIAPTFWAAMVLIVAGVVIGQTNWQKIFGGRWLPPE